MLIFSCSSQYFRKSITDSNSNKKKSSIADEQPKSDSNPDSNDVDEADEPVMVGGAFLTCFEVVSDKGNYGCRAEKGNEKDRDFDRYDDYSFVGLDLRGGIVDLTIDIQEADSLFHWLISSDQAISALSVRDGISGESASIPIQDGESFKKKTIREEGGYLKAGDLCLKRLDDSRLYFEECDRIISNNLEITAVNRVDDIDILPEAIQGLIENLETDGPIFYFTFEDNKCLTAQKEVGPSYILELDSCSLGGSWDSGRQLFASDIDVRKGFKLKNVKESTGGIEGQRFFDLCSGFDSEGSSKTFRLKPCTQVGPEQHLQFFSVP